MPCLFPISFDLLVTVSHGGRTASSLVLRLSFFFFFFFCFLFIDFFFIFYNCFIFFYFLFIFKLVCFFCMCLRISYEIGPISWFSFLCLNLYYPMGMGW